MAGVVSFLVAHTSLFIKPRGFPIDFKCQQHRGDSQEEAFSYSSVMSNNLQL